MWLLNGYFKTIDGLLVGTKYLAWAIALVGIVDSVILFIANLSLGFASAVVFVAAELLSFAVTAMLLPENSPKASWLTGVSAWPLAVYCGFWLLPSWASHTLPAAVSPR